MLICVCIYHFLYLIHICIGIWFTAVYTCHHYIIDVLLGIVTALVGVALTEWVLAHSARGRRWTDRYMSWIRR